jgi:predicted secreted hydrolase
LLATMTPRVLLPRDDAAHTREPLEWWYWTGHLATGAGHWFGFELTFFRTLRRGWPVQLCHHALADVAAGTFRHQSSSQSRRRLPLEDAFDLEVGPCHAQGGGGEDHLHGELDGATLDLTLRALKPPVLQHGDGYVTYDVGGYTYYYSRPRMEARGTVVLEGREEPVAGMAWFDHQWGDLGRITLQGWDWFAVQLEDGRDLMLFMLGPVGSRRLIGGSVSLANGACRELAATDCVVEPLRTWTSPATGCRYPVAWRLRVEDLDLCVQAVMDNQELASDGMVYWEGACVVTGTSTGRAYVELTSYQPV